MTNPVLVEVTRGPAVESWHRGAFVVVNAAGDVLASAGHIENPVYPRSAIKAFQALPLLETGAADAFGFSERDIALACASHGGEPDHVLVAEGMLDKAGLEERDLECGAHWPSWPKAARDLGIAGAEPTPIHNNCSGKHVGMLALAKHMGAETKGYVGRDHPVQREVAETLGAMCDYDLDDTPCGIDGCSVPTWAIPLHNLALGFARLSTPSALSAERAEAASRIFAAVAAEPFLVAGTNRFCTEVMTAVPRAFVKTGAEGVFCGCVPHAGLGIALKCDDGATRASEAMMAAILAELPVFSGEEREAFAGFARRDVDNRRGTIVGEVRPLEDHFTGVGQVKV